MQTEEMLEELLKKAKVDMSLRQKLFDTRNEKNPVSAFCKTCRELGYEIYDMDLISAGEEFYAAMRLYCLITIQQIKILASHQAEYQ